MAKKTEKFQIPKMALSYGEEIIALRKENAKSYLKAPTVIHTALSLGAIHYKDNYSNNQEQWKNIDPTWVGNRVDKAPYILERDGNIFTVTDKRTGLQSVIELAQIGTKEIKSADVTDKKVTDLAPNVDFEVIPQNHQIRFQRTLKNASAAKDAKFKITGDLPIKYQAYDADGNAVELETSIVGGVLTETVKEKSGLKYPIKVDPTLDLTLGASNNDISLGYVSGAWAANLAATSWSGGYISSTNLKRGGGLYYTGGPPQGAQIDTSYITFTALNSLSNTTVNLRITGNKQAVPAVWSTLADYQARRGTVVGGANDDYITTAQVDWDNPAAWTAESTYNSPEIKTVNQEQVNQPGYNGVLALFVDDFDARGDQETNHYRNAYSWDNTPAKAPVLHIEYTLTVPTVTTAEESDATVSGFTANGEVTVEGGGTVTRRGFLYCKGASGNPDESELTNGFFYNWTAGDDAAPDGWALTHSGADTIAKEAADVKTGLYSVKIITDTSECTINNNFGAIRGIAYWWTKTVTVGGWVKCSTSDVARIRARYQIATSAYHSYSNNHTGDGIWQWLTATITVPITAGSLLVDGLISGAGLTASFSGFKVVEGSTIEPTYDVYEDASDWDIGAFDLPVTDLEAATNFRVRAYAVNETGVGVGTTIDALTLTYGVPLVTTQAGDNITPSSFDANGTITSVGAENCTRRGFCYMVGTYGDPDLTDDYVDEEEISPSYEAGAFSLAVEYLLPNTSYRVRAFAQNSYGITFGASVTVLTSTDTPTVTTGAISDILDTTATAAGTIVSVGGDNCSQRGFCYYPGSSGDIDPVAVAGTAIEIEGLSKAAACVVIWTGHGLCSGNQATIAGIEEDEWDDLNATHEITVINENSFSIPVNTSAFAEAYAGSPAGTICRAADYIVTEPDDWGIGTFSLGLTGLTAETSYLIRAFAENDAGYGYGASVDFETLADIDEPTVVTSAATEVEKTTFTAHGEVSEDGGGIITRRGFCYVAGTTGDPTVSDSYVDDTGTFALGAFSQSVTGLYPGTSYRVRAFAENSTGIGYGDSVTVTTDADVPTLTTQNCTSVTGTTATGNGTVLATGGYNLTRRGFVYMLGTTGTPTVDGDGCSVAYDDGDFGAVAFTKSITGLTPGASYRVRAYGVNSVGTGYGTTVQLTTLVVVPTVTTQAATSVVDTSCVGNGNITNAGGGTITRRGFCYKVGVTGDPTTADSTAYDDGTFEIGAYTKTISGLSPEVNYRVRAYAVNSAGVAYGETVQVTTGVTVVAPTVTTQAASDVSYLTATGNGNITATGNATVTRRGFCYMAGTSGDPTTADSVAYDDGTFGTGAFTKAITGLTNNTGYRVRAYAVNSAGTSYGVTVQITTLAYGVPTVTTQAASGVASTYFVGNGRVTATGGAVVTRRGFCYKVGTSGDPTVADSVAYNDGTFGAAAFQKLITSLSSGTTYRVRAYAVNTAGTGYGTTRSVTTTSFDDEKNKRADGPTPINLITFGFATPVYVSDRDVTPSGGAAHLGLVKSWGFIDTSISQQAGQGVLGKIAISDLQLTLINTEAARFSSNFTAADPPENITVTLYQWFAPLSYDAAQVIFKGVIFGQPEYNEYECKLTIRGIFEKYNRQIGADKIITATDFPDADPDDIGKMSNVGYGDLKDVPCRALKAGRIDTLRDNLTAAATSFYVSGEAAADFPVGYVTVQIDDEKIYGFYYPSVNLFSSCTRAYGGTTAMAHDKGAQVAQILTEYIYEVFGHPAYSLGDVRVDGVKQTTGFTKYTGQTGSELAGYEGRAVIKFTTLPTLKKQVNLDVSEGNHNHSQSGLPVIIWRFDDVASLSGGQIENANYAYDGNLNTQATLYGVGTKITLKKVLYEVPNGQPVRWRYCMKTGLHQDSGSVYFVTLGGSAENTVYKGQWGSTSWTWAQFNAYQPYIVAGSMSGFYVGIADVWLEIEYSDLHPATGVALTGNSSADTVIGGLVTCDAYGALDDASGTYTGTASALIERPDHVFRHIWSSLMSAPAADIDEETFVTAGVFYAANSYAFAKLISDPITAEDLLMRLSLQSRSRFICTAAGQAKLFVRQLAQSSTHAVVKNEIKRDSMSIRRSPTDELINLFNISYDLDLTQGAQNSDAYRSSLKFTDATSVTRYGTREWKGGNDVFCFDAVRDATMAEHVGDFLLAYHCRVRKILAFGVFLDNMEIAPGDIIDVTHPLDTLSAFVCEVEKVVHHIGSYKQIDWLQIIATENAT